MIDRDFSLNVGKCSFTISLRHILIFAVLGLVLFLAFRLRFSLISCNFPVSTHVDERFSLSVLLRFHHGSLDPAFFDWPTFYFYLTYVLIKPFSSEYADIVWYGRLINIILGLSLVLSTFLFCYYLFRSVVAGLISAFLTAVSPILILNGSYIITDILLANLILWSIFSLSWFFKTHIYRYWWIGVVTTGLALSTKYTAAPIVMAYLAYEFFLVVIYKKKATADYWLEGSFPSWWLSFGLFICGICSMAIYLFFPSENFLAKFVQQQGDFDSVLGANDMIFVNSVKTKLLFLSIGSEFLFLASLIFKDFFKKLCYCRPYVGLAIIGIVFLAASPFLLLNWQHAVYDIANVMKFAVLGSTQPQWGNFIQHYLVKESILILAFMVVGIYKMLKDRKVEYHMLIIFLVMGFLSYGSGNKVFFRWWTPLIPTIFSIAAYSISKINQSLKIKKWLRAGFNLLIILGVGIEIYPKYVYATMMKCSPSSDHEVYQEILSYRPEIVFHSPRSYMPYLELQAKGFQLKTIPSEKLTEGNKDWLEEMNESDVLIVDGQIQSKLHPELISELELIWFSKKDHQEYMYRRRIE